MENKDFTLIKEVVKVSKILRTKTYGTVVYNFSDKYQVKLLPEGENFIIRDYTYRNAHGFSKIERTTLKGVFLEKIGDKIVIKCQVCVQTIKKMTSVVDYEFYDTMDYPPHLGHLLEFNTIY